MVRPKYVDFHIDDPCHESWHTISSSHIISNCLTVYTVAYTDSAYVIAHVTVPLVKITYC